MWLVCTVGSLHVCAFFFLLRCLFAIFSAFADFLNGNHSHSSSSSSSACAPPSDNEPRPNFDAVMDDRDEIDEELCLANVQTIEANETNELLLTLGADMSVARTTAAELLSPRIFGMRWT